MNVSLDQNLSVYQLAMGVKPPPQPLSLSPATLLSLVRAQIDLLIEQQIAATIWVKLPPGKIWQSELARYQSKVGVSGVIYSCYVGESLLDGELATPRKWGLGTVDSSDEVGSASCVGVGVGEASRREAFLGEASLKENQNFEKIEDKNLTLSTHHRQVQLFPHSLLRREYFLMVLSPQFCSLILAHRLLKRRKNNISLKVKDNKTPALLAITTVEGRVIQRVLDGIKQATAPDSFLLVPADFICPSVPSAALMSYLVAKQLQRQDEINRQQAIERKRQVQQQNQKLHNQDEYLNNVCQELRTPLTHMKTALSLLNSPNLKPPQRQRYLQMLNSLCDRQNSLITGLLDLLELEHNLEKTTLESVRLSEIVPGVVSTYQPVAQEKGIMLAYTVPNDLPAVKCVSGGLRQIVINLLHNSIKFTANGGQVWVRAFVGKATLREATQRASPLTRVQGNYLQLEFRDTGIGIAENEMTKIFDRFYRVRPGATEDPGGAGLGLTIVQQLLWRCGGSISVKSKPSEGSIFTVQLVIAPEKTTQESVL